MSPETEELRARLQRHRTLLLDIKVIPRAGSSEVAGIMPDGVLKLKVMAVPEKGKANEEVCALIAQLLGVPNRNVAVIHGQKSRNKRLRISLP